MTDLSSHNNTHTAPFLDAGLGGPATTPPALQPPATGTSAEDTEDYTIKCICGFIDDDGFTVQCEDCDTWQHIECYYQGNKPGDNENHYCNDCYARALDGKEASKRQQRKRQELMAAPDLRKKKPQGKSHKKKLKTDLGGPHVNGLFLNSELPSPSDASRGSYDAQPPSKKAKTNHRSSHSVNVFNGASHLAGHQSKRSASASHPQSPSKASLSPIEIAVDSFTSEFLQLYHDDPGDKPMQANLFNDISIANFMSEWTENPDAVKIATNGRSHTEVFMTTTIPFDAIHQPSLSKHSKVNRSVEIHSLNPRWIYLTNDVPITQGSIVGELRGKIGRMQDYVQDPSNRWEYLRHPLPFVFFHPLLPIYIDTRREGSLCRYLRRSCRPNLSFKTMLGEDKDMRFCFVTNCDLEADTELTVAWTLDAHVRAYSQQLNGGLKPEGSMDTDESYVIDYVGKLLADFGECACNGADECTMARYDRRRNALAAESARKAKGRKSGKGHQHSLQTTPRVTSRSGSEAVKAADDDEDPDVVDDSRSTSASRSKPQSRDHTPANHSMAERGILHGLELSNRERRKIANLESQMQKLEQERQQARAKKRARTSGGSNTGTPTTTTFANRVPMAETQQVSTSHAFSTTSNPPVGRPKYVNTGTSRRPSGSPTRNSPPLRPPISGRSTSYTIPSPRRPPSNYVDACAQADMDEEEAGGQGTCPIRKPVVSLTKRLLMRCHTDRVRSDAMRSAMNVAQPPPLLSPLTAPALQTQQDTNGDTIMANTESPVALTPPMSSLAPIAMGSTIETLPMPSSLPKMPPPPTSSATHKPTLSTAPIFPPRTANGLRNTNLHVRVPASTFPAIDVETSPAAPSHSLSSIAVTTPTTATTISIHTPTSIGTPMSPHPPIQLHTPLPSSVTPISVSAMTPGSSILPPLHTTPGLVAPTAALALTEPSPIKKKLTINEYMASRKSSMTAAKLEEKEKEKEKEREKERLSLVGEETTTMTETGAIVASPVVLGAFTVPDVVMGEGDIDTGHTSGT